RRRFGLQRVCFPKDRNVGIEQGWTNRETASVARRRFAIDLPTHMIAGSAQMSISTYRQLPSELHDIQLAMEAKAREQGLDVFETIFEVLNLEELCMFAAYGGFPVRYPHWRFGAEYDELLKTHLYGLQRIYEMVINNDPCYAYLLNTNQLVDQKLVIAHVYGHCDFFKCNAWFGHTNRRMLDAMANHATRIQRYVDRFGYEKVEEFIDACLSVEDLID